MAEYPRPQTAEDVVPHLVHFRPHKPSRTRTDERRHGELLKALTVDIVNTYSRCSSAFGYSLQCAPRRVLTKNSKAVHNGGHDNAEHDYICRVGDKINNPDGQSYEILERLGHGTFGQVLKCHPSSGSHGAVALKIIKNKPAYFHQALVEVRILQMLNQEFDADDEKRIVRMLDFFVYRKHLCIAFELLSMNLYDVLRQNSFRGVSMALIRVLTEQMLKAMQCLRDAFVIHCDLKPENVLLMNMQHTKIKLIDFGSACFEKHSVYSYIQSRFYRSPEVLLGLPYTSAIDMWSLGCICAELFLGLPIFPGHSEYNQVCRIVEILGLPPPAMLDRGRSTRRYFKRTEELTEQAAMSMEAAVQSSAQPAAAEALLVDSDGQVSEPAEGQREDAASSAEEAEEVPDGAPLLAMEEESVCRSEESESLRNLRKQLQQQEQEQPRSAARVEDNSAPAPAGSAATVGQQQTTSGGGVLLLGTLNRGQREGLAASESGHSSAVSQMSTAAETSEVVHSSSRRRPYPCHSNSHEVEQAPHDGSSDGHGEPRASGSSDGGGRRAPRLTESSVSSDTPNQQARRGRAWRSRGARTCWRLKTREEYERDEHKKEPTPKKYFEFKSLEQMVELIPYKKDVSVKEEHEKRQGFLQFLRGVLQINPDERWTPKQAENHTFITGEHYDPDFRPTDDIPVPSFTTAPLPGTAAFHPAGPLPGVEVPRLPAEAMGPFGAYTGGGSARTVQENALRQRNTGGGMDAEQPRSAPASTRGQGAAGPAMVANRMMAFGKGGEGEPGSGEVSGMQQAGGGGQQDMAAMLSEYASGFWKMPDDTTSESYRPPVDKMPEDFFRSVALRRDLRSHSGDQVVDGSPQKARNGAWSVSTGASWASSASSTGSTPTGGRGRRGVASPHSGGSPISTGVGPGLKGHLSHLVPPAAGPSSSRHHPPGPHIAPASSPQGSGAMHVAGGPHGGQAGHRHSGGVLMNPVRAAGSRDGSRGSSPWHMSEPSTASDRINSSQPSGSESCGENPTSHYEGAHCNYDEFASEDPSQSDYGLGQSDSDRTTPRSSHDAGPNRQEEDRPGNQREPGQTNWESMLTARTFPRRMEQSPGTSAMGGFRDRVGMPETGPVVPPSLGARRLQSTERRNL